MSAIVFDCERMKYSNTGLYNYCLQLGLHLKQALHLPSDNLTYYLPRSCKGIFGNGENYIIQNSFQKFWLPSLGGHTIWHATYQSTDYLPARNRKIKVVLTIHDVNFLHEPDISEVKKQKNLLHLQNNITRSDAIVCISEFCRQDVLLNCEVGNKQVQVIHNGTNSLMVPLLSPQSYKPKRPFIFSIGCVNRKKNFHVLLPLVQQNREMELVIAGRTEDRSYVRYINDQAKEMGVAEKVRVIGSISEPEKSWYFQNCYAFTFPSLAEGFGLPVTEAMSLGKPVFLSHLTSLPEIGENAAFYFDDFEAKHMQQVFLSGMQQYVKHDMSDLIKKRSTDFCWTKAAQQYLKVYHSL